MATMTGCVSCGWRASVRGTLYCDECTILVIAAVNLQILLGLPKRMIKRMWTRGGV